MPNPCPPHAFTRNYGPFQVGFTVEVPLGYVDQMLELDDHGMSKISELQQSLTRAFDEHPPELAVSLNDAGSTTVYCGIGSAIVRGRPPLNQGAAEDDAVWTAPVWLYAPYSPSDNWLDYPYIAQLWVASLSEVQLPGKLFPATLLVETTAFQAAGGDWGILPPDYQPGALPSPI